MHFGCKILAHVPNIICFIYKTITKLFNAIYRHSYFYLFINNLFSIAQNCIFCHFFFFWITELFLTALTLAMAKGKASVVVKRFSKISHISFEKEVAQKRNGEGFIWALLFSLVPFFELLELPNTEFIEILLVIWKLCESSWTIIGNACRYNKYLNVYERFYHI